MARPTVDVVIAARNEAAELSGCLGSLAEQDYPAELIRIIVVDNGSSDATPRIARDHGAVVLHESRPGPACARNTGIRSGTGELIAMFDGHCVASPHWISSMVRHFADERIGGVQGHIDNRGRNSRIDRYLVRTQVVSNDAVLDDTVRGSRNVYPWILTGNSMFRRSAIEEAGFFDERLPACEDVDLSWRLVLLGYLLDYCAGARVTHYNGDTWRSFVRKARRQGRGSAVLAHRYLPHGASNAFRPGMIWTDGPERAMIALSYWLGYRAENLRLRLESGEAGGHASDTNPHPRFRSPAEWCRGEKLRISPDCIYWLPEKGKSIIVHRPSRSRIVLEKSGDLIWRDVARGASRDSVIDTLCKTYGIDASIAALDLAEFIEELVLAGVLERLGT